MGHTPVISVPAAAREICDTLSKHGHGAWIVGGCVRDSLREGLLAGATAPLPPPPLANDWDIATSARPEQVKALFRKVIPTGIAHGTVTVVINKVHYEVTTLRAELGYSDGRRPDKVEFVDDIVADLARRDFTINAIAYDIRSDTLIDPFGGLADLRAKRLRAVGDPAQRFAEDGLRVLRAARFVATLEVTLDPDTEGAIRPSLQSYAKVSAERIRDEWLKALKASQPSSAFEIMNQHGMLEITAPALAAAEQLQYALTCLDLSPKIPALQLACLLHVLAPQALDSAERAHDLLRDLRFSNTEQDRIAALIRHGQIDYDARWSDADVRRWLQRVSPSLAEDLLTVAQICQRDTDAAGGLAALRSRARMEIERGAPLSLRDLAINGGDLIRELQLPPGPKLGALLELLLGEALENPALNERRALLERAAQLFTSV